MIIAVLLFILTSLVMHRGPLGANNIIIDIGVKGLLEIASLTLLRLGESDQTGLQSFVIGNKYDQTNTNTIFGEMSAPYLGNTSNRSFQLTRCVYIYSKIVHVFVMDLVIQEGDIALMTVKDSSCHCYKKLWKESKDLTNVEDSLDFHAPYKEKVLNFVGYLRKVKVFL